MKALIIAALALVSATAFGGQPLELNSKDVNYGALRQATRSAALDRVEVIRTKKTPKKVDVSYTVKESEQVCVEYRYEQVWHPGHYDRVCHTTTDRNGNTRTICRNVWRPGYYTTERRCVRTESVMVTRNKSIRFNFKKAARLSSGQREVFMVEFRQDRVSSDDVTMSGEVVEANRSYNIRFEKFLKNSLKFEVK
ncbi:MAG: hypothetical protein CME70_15830 [Halobacteriovorax sp.]|nr:hypothetical protein [Halobacteriovorax sp.]|tara:strand:- start:34307 stop:34891 length:585 start_codon:yes stop_codon:yes gene_type:complete